MNRSRCGSGRSDGGYYGISIKLFLCIFTDTLLLGVSALCLNEKLENILSGRRTRGRLRPNRLPCHLCLTRGWSAVLSVNTKTRPPVLAHRAWPLHFPFEVLALWMVESLCPAATIRNNLFARDNRQAAAGNWLHRNEPPQAGVPARGKPGGARFDEEIMDIGTPCGPGGSCQAAGTPGAKCLLKTTRDEEPARLANPEARGDCCQMAPKSLRRQRQLLPDRRRTLFKLTGAVMIPPDFFCSSAFFCVVKHLRLIGGGSIMLLNRYDI